MRKKKKKIEKRKMEFIRVKKKKKWNEVYNKNINTKH